MYSCPYRYVIEVHITYLSAAGVVPYVLGPHLCELGLRLSSIGQLLHVCILVKYQMNLSVPSVNLAVNLCCQLLGGSVVERRSLIGELSLVCTGPAADG